MYGALWRVLPGPAWLRIIILLVAVAAMLAAFHFWLFPWIQPFIAPQDATVGDGS